MCIRDSSPDIPEMASSCSICCFLILSNSAVFFSINSFCTSIDVYKRQDVDIPEISIHYTQDNASVNEMENSITNLLRGQLQQIPSFSDITSESREGSGTITMKFEYGTSIDYASVSYTHLPYSMLPNRISRLLRW